jgi:hypothetical protein
MRDIEVHKTIIYADCADAFGWTPNQVDAIDKVELEGIMTALEHKRKREAQQ